MDEAIFLSNITNEHRTETWGVGRRNNNYFVFVGTWSGDTLGLRKIET